MNKFTQGAILPTLSHDTEPYELISSDVLDDPELIRYREEVIDLTENKPGTGDILQEIESLQLDFANYRKLGRLATGGLTDYKWATERTTPSDSEIRSLINYPIDMAELHVLNTQRLLAYFSGYGNREKDFIQSVKSFTRSNNNQGYPYLGDISNIEQEASKIKAHSSGQIADIIEYYVDSKPELSAYVLALEDAMSLDESSRLIVSLQTLAMVDAYIAIDKLPLDDLNSICRLIAGTDTFYLSDKNENLKKGLSAIGLIGAMNDRSRIPTDTDTLGDILDYLKAENPQSAQEILNLSQKYGIIFGCASFLELQSSMLAEELHRCGMDASKKVRENRDKFSEKISYLTDSNHSRPVGLMTSLAIENYLNRLQMLTGQKPSGRPLHNFLEQEADQQGLEALKLQIANISERINSINHQFETSSKEARQLFYSYAGKDYSAIHLRRLIEDTIFDKDGHKSIFNKDQADTLAGLALKIQAEEFPTKLFKALNQLDDYWSELIEIAPNSRQAGLTMVINKLLEWDESLLTNDSVRNRQDIKPLFNLIKLIRNRPEPTSEDLTDQEPSADSDIASEDVVEIDLGNEDKLTLAALGAEFLEIEFIQAFEPGNDSFEVIEREIRHHNKGKYPVEWDRIRSLIDLRSDLTREGFQVRTLRLMQSRWHPLPHYVLEVKNPISDLTCAVIESPIYGNATYVIPNDEWRVIVEESKEDVRQIFGGIAKMHSPDTPSSHHKLAVMNTVVANC